MVIRVNYLLDRFREVVWIVGDGRSGTTWLSEIVNHGKRYRDMFEPFHPLAGRQMNGMDFFKYLQAECDDDVFYRLARKVFTGELQNSRVDAQNNRHLYEGLLIKDIFANLILGWAHNRFPDVKKIFLLRHPFAVALSKRRLQH